eukprot:415117_1
MTQLQRQIFHHWIKSGVKSLLSSHLNMNSCLLSLFELYMILFGLTVLSITSLLPLSIYLWIANTTPFYYGFIPITTQIVLLCTSIKYFNFIRFILYPFRWLAITQVLYFALWTSIIKQLPSFYKHISSYNSLTNLYSIQSNNNTKYNKKARNKMLKRVPKSINTLIKSNKLQIKTISANYLKRQHFKLLVEHSTLMTTGKGKSILAKYNQILELFLVLFFSVGIFDEFYLDDKLVAFQYGTIINDSYTAFQWYASAKARKQMLYFEGIRRELKRCIAHPDIKYYNVMYTSSGDSGANRAKLECGMDKYLVNEQNDCYGIGKIYGYNLHKYCACCCCWVSVKDVYKQYWNNYDESDSWCEEKEQKQKQLEEERKINARKIQQKNGNKRKRNKMKCNSNKVKVEQELIITKEIIVGNNKIENNIKEI